MRNAIYSPIAIVNSRHKLEKVHRSLTARKLKTYFRPLGLVTVLISNPDNFAHLRYPDQTFVPLLPCSLAPLLPSCHNHAIY
ncbi:MAG: hypothetical protein F6J90_14680 [Moorea sp. SIOASIH]|nr:hypothetical protein [Moorena sp. SIOASIH]